MRINRVKFRGFGCWVDKEFLFHEGINLIEAPNEAGKSTLIQGIFALLYGSKKEGVRKKVKSDWYDRYIPWLGNHYGGEVDYSIHNQPFRIIRSLFLPHEKMQLIALRQGIDITHQFPLDRKKDRLFLEEQIGFSGDALKRIVFLAPRSLTHERDEHEQQAKMIEKMRAVLYGQDVDIEPALMMLEKDIQEIGTPKQETKKLGSALSQCALLEEELTRLKRDYTVLMEDIHCRGQLDKKKKQLYEKKQELMRERQRIQIASRRNKLQEVDQKIDCLKQEYKRLDSFQEEEAYLKIRMLEEFSQLEKKNLMLIDVGTDSMTQQRLAEDISKVIHLEEKEKILGREQHGIVTQLSQQYSHKPLGQNGWAIGTFVCLFIGFIFSQWLPFLSVFPLSTGCFTLYKWISLLLHRKKDLQLQGRSRALARELEQIHLLKTRVLEYWYADSLTSLQEMENRQRFNEQDGNEAIQNEQRMEQIHQDVKKWLALFSEELPPFHPEQWIQEVRILLHQAKEFRGMVCQLEGKKLSIHKQGTYDEQYGAPVSKEFQDLEDTYYEIEKQLTSVIEERAKLEGKIEKMSEFVAVLPQKETEWELVRREVANLETERNASMLAKKILLETASETQATIGSELIPHALKWFQKITDYRYNEVFIQLHQGIHLNVLVPETGESQTIDALSQGTVDQLLLSLRFGLLQLYANRSGIALPLILDDCFVQFDETRVQNVLYLLGDLAKMGHQIILCSCHTRERVSMERLGIPYHLTTLDK